MIPELGALAAIHGQELDRFRSSMNLVGPGPVDVHFKDSWLALRSLEPAGAWADLGSGAGFPGLVFADIFPDVAMTLVDSRRKRCWFLEHVLRLAGRSDVEVLCQRVEGLASHRFDGIVSRAFAPPASVLDHAERLLRPNGQVVVFLQADAAPYLRSPFSLESSHDYRFNDKYRRIDVLRRNG